MNDCMIVCNETILKGISIQAQNPIFSTIGM
ncbi:unnamed protein product, partial [marine sediment metagenome]